MDDSKELVHLDQDRTPANQSHDILLEEIRALQKTVKKLETDIEDIKYFTPEPHKPFLDKETIGTIGGILLGALVIIGIFF